MRDFRQIPALIDALFQAGIESMRQVASNVRKRMMVEGKPVTHPVQWDSERQRRAFFATGGFGKGIPYRRQNRYRFGWQDQMEPFGASLHNESPAGAIGGLASGWQSRIHRGRWPYLLDVLFDELSKVPAEVSKRLKYTVLSGKQ
jgi:hypothetical protein